MTLFCYELAEGLRGPPRRVGATQRHAVKHGERVASRAGLKGDPDAQAVGRAEGHSSRAELLLLAPSLGRCLRELLHSVSTGTTAPTRQELNLHQSLRTRLCYPLHHEPPGVALRSRTGYGSFAGCPPHW